MKTIQSNPPRVLTAQGLCKNYGEQTVLKDLDLALEPGRIYGLIGRNGAGKTTLLSLLTGQNLPTAGAITYGGAPVWENAAALSEFYFARELASGSDLGSLAVKRFLRAAALFCPYWDEPYAQSLLQKFNVPTNKTINKLSRGQASMLAITVALASRAPVTLLDEPTAGLDVVMREKFYHILLEDYAATGRTFVISTHIIEEAAGVFERVVILDEGKVVADEPTDALLDRFRSVSGPTEAVQAALAARGLTPMQSQQVGKYVMTTVRGTDSDWAALADDPALDLEGMNLQNVFVALCGHGDEEG